MIKPIETLTSEEKAAVRTGIGAAAVDASNVDPAVFMAGIGAEAVLAELEGEEFEPETLFLPDFEDSTPPANAVGLSGGRIALGDGTTVGGKPLTPRRVAGMRQCLLDGTNKTSARFAIVGIPLTAAEVVEDSLIEISGTVKLLWNNDFYSSEDPVISATIGFAHSEDKTAATTRWIKHNCLPTGTEFVFLVTNEIAGRIGIVTNVGEGADQLRIGNFNSVIFSDRWGGAAGATFSKNTDSGVVDPSDSTISITEETADEIWLSVEIVMGASGTNPDIYFSVVYDLDIAVTLP
jgi:hypothetical protein